MRAQPGSTRWAFIFYLALLIWAPVPLGSNRPFAWPLLALWVLLLALWWLAGFLRGRHAYPAVLRDAWPMLLCGLLWLAYVWVQQLPIPFGLLELISPQSAYWHAAAARPDMLTAAPLTLDAYATLEAAGKSTAYVVFFALSLILLHDRDRIRYAAYTLIASGVLQALYGAITSLQSPGEVATGTFANRNHYAAYLTMCLSVGIGVLIASLSGAANQPWQQHVRNLVHWVITPKMALRLGLVTMVIALVLTHSRMGNSSFFFSLLIAGAIGLLLSKRATKSMVILLISLVVIDIFIVGAYFGTRRVVERISQTTVETEDRDEVAGYAIDMWKDYPVFGSGLGSFPVVFPRYSADGTAVAYTHAHNDYLEFGAEVGALGLSLLGLMVLMSLVVAVRAQFVRSDPLMRGISFGAMMGILALMIHSFVDFNLQIPANALTFMLLLAFAWIALYHARTRP